MEIIRAWERGFFDHGWLKTYHTFSFADYYDPARIRFGKLRVVNDDTVEGLQGFGMHSHRDMEIISIPLYGKLEHEDSEGNRGIIEAGEIQVMTAGTGIMHSERNPTEKPVNFLQIWIFPEKKDLKPSYEQKKFENPGWNTFQLLVSPTSTEGSLGIHQNAFLSQLFTESGKETSYRSYEPGNGLFLFLLKGSIILNSQRIEKRDTALLLPGEIPHIESKAESHLLFIEVPMN